MRVLQPCSFQCNTVVFTLLFSKQKCFVANIFDDCGQGSLSSINKSFDDWVTCGDFLIWSQLGRNIVKIARVIATFAFWAIIWYFTLPPSALLLTTGWNLWTANTHLVHPFTVSLHSPNGRHLPVVRAVQGDCQWPLKNGGNPQQSREPRIHWTLRQLQSIFRPTNYNRLMSVNRRPCLIPRWQSYCHQPRTVKQLNSHINHWLKFVNCEHLSGPTGRSTTENMTAGMGFI